MKCITLILIVLTSLGGLFFPSSSLYGAEDTFQVEQVITDGAADTDPPTIPTNLVATAVSSSQIDLSWTASTDNDEVDGYRVFRDLVFIATSTGTTYSDTGLTPETPYAYTVTAFDSSFNFSTTSATATATTLAAPVEDEADSGSSGSLQNIVVLNLSVEPGLSSAVISFETNLYTQAILSWGETTNYELGSVAGALFLKSHSINIEGLDPGTTYYFKIELTDAYGKKLILENETFATSLLPDSTPPTNVTNLKAVGDDKIIVLTWNNPSVDFDSVRIVKSDKFYPKDLFDGEVIYEGRAEMFVDTEVVYGKLYYYTVFAKDLFGNYSSGAITHGTLYRQGDPVTPHDPFDVVPQVPGWQVHPLINSLTIFDLNFFQSGEKIVPSAGIVRLRGDREFSVSLDYNRVPEILKTITVTMYDSKDPQKTFSFLLRVNKDKSAYEAHIAPLGQSGDFAFGVSILDYKNQGLKKIAGVIVASMPEFAPHMDWSFRSIIVSLQQNIPSILAIILVLVLMYLSYRSFCGFFKRKNSNDIR